MSAESSLFHYHAVCSCGQVCVKVGLPEPIEHYSPRLCDCDFCQLHHLAYLSDPNGTLAFADRAVLNIVKQGSNQADFMQCSECKQIIGVVLKSPDNPRGAVNARLFDESYTFAAPIVVSPKQFGPQEKRQRWSTLWLQVIDF